MPLGAAKIAYQGYQVVAAEPEPRTTASTITAINDAQIDTAQSKFGGASALFDGTDDYIDVTLGDAIVGSDWTLECWVRNDGTWSSTSETIFIPYAGADNTTTHIGTMAIYNGYIATWRGGWSVGTTNQLSNNTWHHVSWTRSGGAVYCHVDGQFVISRGNSAGSTGCGYVRVNHTNGDFAGWLDEIRITAGNRYGVTTGNYTAPTAPFVNDADTRALIHADGTDASTTFPDDVGVRASVGVSAYGDAQVDTANKKYGTGSLLLDGTGDGLLANNDLDLSSGAWTMECWYYPLYTGTTEIVFDPRFGSQPARVPSWRNGGIAYFNGAWNVSTNRFSANTWYHMAWVYDGSNVKCYVDGTLELTVSESGTFIDSKLAIGARYDLAAVYLSGAMDEIRISNTARYTSNFTAPTSAFTNDANTVLLLHMDGTDTSTDFIDDNE